MRHDAKCAYCDHHLMAQWRQPSFSICEGCGLILRNPMPSRQELDAGYRKAWENPLDNPAETGDANDGYPLQYAEELIRSCKLHPGARVLDYGAGRGAAMRYLRDRGLTVIGIEPYGLAMLRRQGLTAYADLETLPPDITFDCIFSNDVLEHLPEPWILMRDLLPRLKPGGKIVVSTPNPNGLRARLRRGRWREAANPGHLCFLTPYLLARLLREAGFSDPRPLAWDIRYTDNPLTTIAQKMLRRLGLDGVTRVVATAPG